MRSLRVERARWRRARLRQNDGARRSKACVGGCFVVLLIPLVVLVGGAQLLAEHPDESGRIVQAEGAGFRFLLALAFALLLLFVAVRLFWEAIRP